MYTSHGRSKMMLLGLTLLLALPEFTLETPITDKKASDSENAVDNTGYFWQITDIHYDWLYSLNGDIYSMCHHTDVNDPPGLFGDFLCDSPWELVMSAVNAMKKFNPNPDFILWTGDSAPHLDPPEMNMTMNLQVINKVTNLLAETFPETIIAPTLGNHDYWPANEMPEGPAVYYENLLNQCNWSHLLTDQELITFRRGGYYQVAPVSSNLVLIGLNTIQWYYKNDLNINLTDPSDQFKWLEETLESAKTNGKKVILHGHVPPGIFDFPWFPPERHARLLNIIRKYSDIITGGIFGHEHTDQFRIIFKKGLPVVPVFLAASVTPWVARREWRARYPSITLYKYDRIDGSIVDVIHYYLNLTAANERHQADWLLEYQFTSAYGVKDVSVSSLIDVVRRFNLANSTALAKYNKYFRVSYDPQPCDNACRQKYVCAITHVDYIDNAACMASLTEEKSKPTPHPHHRQVPHYMYYVIYSLVAFVALVFIAVTVYCCCREPRRVVYFSQPRYVLIT